MLLLLWLWNEDGQVLDSDCDLVVFLKGCSKPFRNQGHDVSVIE